VATLGSKIAAKSVHLLLFMLATAEADYQLAAPRATSSVTLHHDRLRSCLKST